MARLLRAIVRAAALLGLIVGLIGVPVLLAQLVGRPYPSLTQLRASWTTRQVDTEAVIRIGCAIFVMLWVWFAFTAVSELARVLRWRARTPQRPMPPLRQGPGEAVRWLVRVALLSSVTVSASLGPASFGPAPFAAGTASTPTAVPAPGAVAHEVVRGDSYWRIAERHLTEVWGHEPSGREVYDYVEELMELNVPRLGHRDPALIHPGEVVVYTPVAGVAVDPPLAEAAPTHLWPVMEMPSDELDVQPVPETPVTPTPVIAGPSLATTADHVAGSSDSDGRRSDSSLPVGIGLSAAVLVSAGAIRLLESRRHQQLRAAEVGARLVVATPSVANTELLLRRLDEPERLARLDLAVRAAAGELADQDDRVLAAITRSDGEVRLLVGRSSMPVDPIWRLDIATGAWILPAAITMEELAERARHTAQPCPALVHLGAARGGQLFVDLESAGLLCIDAPAQVGADIVRCIAASLAVSPFAEAARLITAGLPALAHLGNANAEMVAGLDDALEVAAEALGSTVLAAQCATTFALRTRGTGGEGWEPAVVLAAGESIDARLASDLVELAGSGGRGLAVVVDRPIEGATWVLRAGRGRFVLEPLGIDLEPAGLEEADLRALHDLLDAARLPLETDAGVLPLVAAGLPDHPYEEAGWALMVRLLGQVEVVSGDGATAQFERSKALELVVWLSQHREHSTRTGARTALWDLDVRDATFANVVSDARRAMARVVSPPDGEEWLGRTLTEQLPLHAHVTTDAEMLARRVAHARLLTHEAAVEVLRPGLELVTGMPFAGTSYLWPDAEGITSSLTLLVTSAATELANHFLVLGDAEGVFWATGQGLKALAGHEELIALRMRAHARSGDLAGVRHEWEAYERALLADPWSANEPSPKLAAVRRELLSPSLAS